jgi:hypothetical protein
MPHSEPTAISGIERRRTPTLDGTENLLRVTVYRIKCFDAFRGEEHILRCMATRSGARLLGNGFEIVEGSGLEIDASQLDRDEVWAR